MIRMRVFPILLFLVLVFGYHSSAQQQPLTDVIISTDLATGLNGGWRAGYSDIDDGLAVAMAYFQAGSKSTAW
jgi:hypothetical protein